MVFIEFYILICIFMGRQKRTHLNPAPSHAIRPPAQPQPSQPKGEESHPTPGSCPGFPRDKKRDATATSWPTSYTLTSQGTIILPGCPPAFFDIEERIHHRSKKSVTNFRKPLEVGQTNHNLQTPSYWRDLTAPPSANSSHRSAEASLLNSRMNI